MSTFKKQRMLSILLTLVLLTSLFFTPVQAITRAAPSSPVTFTILHTNDFHGQLIPSNTDPLKASNPGFARVATVVNAVRTAKGAENVLLVDGGDHLQGSLLSNLGNGTPDGKGSTTTGAFNALGYDVATFGNHEFDWGQTILAARAAQATFPYVTANIVVKDGADCASSGWTKPDFADAAYVIKTIGTAPNEVKVAFIGVTTTETPTITVATATAGLCFKDPADSIVHYYDAMKADGADVIVVLSHLGYADGGYGYGIPVYGDQTLATKLNTAGKPVNLIIGGHSHTAIAPPGTLVGQTLVVQAHYNGRRVGEADITVNPDGSVSVSWKAIVWKIPTAPNTTPPANWYLTEFTGGSVVESVFASPSLDPTIDALITSYATDPTYLALVNTPIGYSAVDLPRNGGVVDNMMATFIDDAIYNYLNTDGTPANDVDLFFNNSGGIRTDWCYVSGSWSNTGCAAGLHDPGLLTYGNMFTVLPFGNATVVGQMTGAQILDVLNYGPNLTNGVLQPAGLKYSYFKYTDANPGPQPYAWGAFDISVYNKTTSAWEPLDLKKVYKVGTNEFLAPAGGDGYAGFKYMTNITYWGDMLNAVNAYVTAHYGTADTAYKGPNGDGTLDARIKRDGNDAGGSIVPITILHHNDSHGNLVKGTYVGYTQLATLIKQERLHNPNRTLLLNAGDSLQGDAMMYYFKDAGGGYASDGMLLPPALRINPMIAVMNSMNYTAMTLGNHEFNFGSKVFVDTFSQASFPLLGANMADTGEYGINKVAGPSTNKLVVNVRDSISVTLPSGTSNPPVNVGILGLTNHRIPNYELPSNIVGLTFSNPIDKAKELVPALRASNDVVLAMTHIGFTENPASVEVDSNVDTYLAAQVGGIDAIVGSHSHTNPASGFGAYKYLPAIVPGPDGKPVVIHQAYRYNNTLGELVVGVRFNAVSGKYEVVSQTGRYLTVTSSTLEDAATKAIVDPYAALLAAYNNKVVGETTVAIDALQAFTQETNAANLQADASVYELETRHQIPVDVHLSGAMTNRAVATSGPYPVSLKVADMFTLMPYENSLLVLSMNGPQLKRVLERAYRNYYYYKYVPGYGGYSYYTTCMLVTDSGNKISYRDTYPLLPNGNNVAGLTIGGVPVDFNDAAKYYKVSTVNYLAAGSCNFNDSGVSLWPLNQILNDTQYYVRDAVIDYITDKGTVTPAVEGRLDILALSQRYWFPLVGR